MLETCSGPLGHSKGAAQACFCGTGALKGAAQALLGATGAFKLKMQSLSRGERERKTVGRDALEAAIVHMGGQHK